MTNTPTIAILWSVKHKSTIQIDRFARVAFYTPIGTENVRWDLAQIEGNWKPQAAKFRGEKGYLLAERFVNARLDPESAAIFTKRWGPIFGNPDDGRKGFSFTLDSWFGTKLALQELWRIVQRSGAIPFQPVDPVTVEFENGRIVLRCPDLYTHMCLELMSNPKKLRVCKRPDCSKPYFLAQHGKEQYCSLNCASWAQSFWKKRWHEEQRQKLSASGGTDGTQETG